MAKKKSSTRYIAPGKIWNKKKPLWMRITKLITVILLSIVLLMAIAGIIIKYYRLINYK
jgi:hypothetical protein